MSYNTSKKRDEFEPILTSTSFLINYNEGSALAYLYEMGYMGKKSANRVMSLKSDLDYDRVIAFDYLEEAKGNVTYIKVKLGRVLMNLTSSILVNSISTFLTNKPLHIGEAYLLGVMKKLLYIFLKLLIALNAYCVKWFFCGFILLMFSLLCGFYRFN